MNVQWLEFDLRDINELRLEPQEFDEYRLLPGDLLVCKGGEPGAAQYGRIVVTRCFFRRRSTGFGHSPESNRGFCCAVSKQTRLNGKLASYFTGATIKHLTGQSLARYVLPLPPVAGQRRIGQRLKQLKALCDDLEAKLRRARIKSERVASALVHHLTAS